MPLKKLVLFALVAPFVLASCNWYPGDNATTDQLDAIITEYDVDVDFQNMKTYALAEEVTPVSGDPNTPPDFTISPDLNNVIITTIKANMAAYGWTLVDTADNPDLAIALGASKTRNTNYYQSWWGGSWYYPWSPYNTTVSSYEVGTLMMVGLNWKNKNAATQQIPVAWIGLVQGALVPGTVDEPLERMQRDINIAFETSPYLNLN